jgi:Flagellar protein FlaF
MPLSATIKAANPGSQNILNVGAFVMAETFSLMTRPKPEHLANIIRINRRIAAGLRGKAVTQHSAPSAAARTSKHVIEPCGLGTLERKLPHALRRWRFESARASMLVRAKENA